MEWQEKKSSDCPGCRELYKDRDPPEEPPCDVCRVVLKEENHEAARIYHIAKSQVRTAGEAGEVIGLDYAAVKAVMDIYGVRDQRDCFEKVSRAHNHFLVERRKEQG